MAIGFTDQRISYEKGVLEQASVPDSPFELFAQWMQQAYDAQVPEPYAMSLATCGKDMRPSVRTVLLREITETGVVFYSNYESAKGIDIDDNPQAEVLFFWHALERQVRISGTIAKIDRQKSEDYFQARPHDSQVGAWVSQPQSGVVADREVMEASFSNLKTTYPPSSLVPTPPFWGGYEITATDFEFWQGRANRMHDRIVYHAASSTTGWTTQRLLP